MAEYTRYCSLCGLCKSYVEDLSKICPRMDLPKENEQHMLGKYQKAMLVKGKFKGTYSGSVVSILLAAKKIGLVDGVLGVERGETIIQAKPKYATTVMDIEKLSGMRHTVSSHLSIMNKVPINDKIALVGLPCHIEAIYNIKKKRLLKHKIEYLIGIACGTNYEYRAFCNLIQSLGINIERVKYYVLRETERLEPFFLFVLDNGSKFKLPVSKTVNCIPEGCNYCNDYLGYHSDLSLGVLGAPKGYSLAFIRNKKGQLLIKTASNEGYLEVKEISQNFISRFAVNFYKILPIEFYLPLAFKTKNIIGAELMARYKVYHLNKRLRAKLKER